MRTKDLSNTATEEDLEAGDYIPLDGNTGTSKLPSNLLTPKSYIAKSFANASLASLYRMNLYDFSSNTEGKRITGKSGNAITYANNASSFITSVIKIPSEAEVLTFNVFTDIYPSGQCFGIVDADGNAINVFPMSWIVNQTSQWIFLTYDSVKQIVTFNLKKMRANATYKNSAGLIFAFDNSHRFDFVLSVDNYDLPYIGVKFPTTKIKPSLILPKNLRCAAGKQMNIYPAQILEFTDVSIFQHINYASWYMHKDHVNFTPTDSSTNVFSMPLLCYKDNVVEAGVSGILTTYYSRTTYGSGLTKKVLVIGDSLTHSGKITQGLLNNFASDAMGIELLGTRGTSPNLHEGRSGWSSYNYTHDSSYLGVSNPFFNPITQEFDFSYYMTNEGFSGVDYVIIALGSNDDVDVDVTSNKANYDKMISSIKAYNANAIISLWLPPQGYYMYAGNRQAIERRQIFDKWLLSEYDDRENENIFVMPVLLNVDPLHDFPYTMQPISDRNTSFEELKITDWTHPSDAGYAKIADVIFGYLKYYGSL